MSSALIISKTQLLLIVLLPLLGILAGLFGRKIGRQARTA
jgi:NADH-quinone oxidoreductase subunit L